MVCAVPLVDARRLGTTLGSQSRKHVFSGHETGRQDRQGHHQKSRQRHEPRRHSDAMLRPSTEFQFPRATSLGRATHLKRPQDDPDNTAFCHPWEAFCHAVLFKLRPNHLNNDAEKLKLKRQRTSSRASTFLATSGILQTSAHRQHRTL